MAEQEACASAVTEALAAAGETTEGDGSARGESLLLPLLQGLLGGGGSRLLAGLGAAPPDVVADVRRSLARLRLALEPPAAHPQSRALLTLADRLEDALDAANRLDGCRRKPRRRSRASRHTVGVTREELAEARRLVDPDLDLDAAPAPDTPASSSVESTPERKGSLEDGEAPAKRGNEEAAVVEKRAPTARKPDFYRHSVAETGYSQPYRQDPEVQAPLVQPMQQPLPQAQQTPQRQPIQQLQPVQQPQHIQAPQPVEQTQPIQQPNPIQQLQPNYQQPQLIQLPQQIYQPQPGITSPPTQQAPYQLAYQPQSAHQHQHLQQSLPNHLSQPVPQSQSMFEPQTIHRPHQVYQSQPLQPRSDRRGSDSKSSIAAIANKFDANARIDKENIPRRAPVEQNQRDLKREELKRNLYMPLPPTYNFAAPPSAEEDSKPLSRFGNGNRRLRMKRANTIDIGRPLAGYRVDSDTDEDNGSRAPAVPQFRAQTDSDRKFVAFMKKTETAEREASNGHANWSNRFGNIKHTFENREKEDHSRSSSASSARRFWRAADENNPSSNGYRPRKSTTENNADIIKPPWISERREQPRTFFPRHPAAPAQSAPPKVAAPAPAPAPAPAIAYAPAASSVNAYAPMPPSNMATLAAPTHAPPPPQTHVPQSPTKPLVVKPFAARPIPVNQFSHAPMSAFKPLAKVPSPTGAPAHIWSPPSLSSTASPTADAPPSFPSCLPPDPAPPGAPWTAERDRPRRVLSLAAARFEGATLDPPAPSHYRERPLAFQPPTPPTHAPPAQNFPVRSIPSQNDLAAPELVRRMDDAALPGRDPPEPKVDAQKLQIEFYEQQIREKSRRDPAADAPREPADRKPPAPPAYTVTDYTPPGGVSTFVPLQRTPDIEKARAHKVDYLPDVVANDTDRSRGGPSPRSPPSPYQNGLGGAPLANGGPGGATEHGSVVTRVMRGPVRGAATITAGARTRDGHARDSLLGALDKMASPKHEVLAQIERRRREAARSQVRAPVHDGRSPLPALPALPSLPSPHPRPAPGRGQGPPSPGALGASRESVVSSESGSPGSNPLSRSGSWHQIVGSPKAGSPRRVVARAKSMHLLAVPKLYEGGIAREEVTEKKRTVEAYFSGQTRSGAARCALRQSQSQSQAQSQAYSLGRSRTMPTVSELQFLDESNTDDAFEDLVSALA